MLGVSRTLFAMSGHRDMPVFLSAVHPRYRVPHRAELLVGALVAIIAAIVDVRTAIGSWRTRLPGAEPRNGWRRRLLSLKDRLLLPGRHRMAR